MNRQERQGRQGSDRAVMRHACEGAGKGAAMLILEKDLEPETVSMLNEIRQADPGSQREVARGFPAKLVTGAYLSRLGLAMVPFGCHLKFAPSLGALFCRYEREELADRIEIELEHWKALGLDLTIMQGMVRTYYEELRRKCGMGQGEVRSQNAETRVQK